MKIQKFIKNLCAYILVCSIVFTLVGTGAVFAAATLVTTNELALLEDYVGVDSKDYDDSANIKSAGYNPDGSLVKPYITYKLDGELESFSFLGINYGRSASGVQYYATGGYSAEVSPDGITWESVSLSFTNVTDKETLVNTGITTTVRNYSVDTIDEGNFYLRINFPEVLDAGASERLLVTNVDIKFNADPKVSLPEKVEASDNVRILFSKEMDPATFDASYFTIDNGAEVISADLLDDGVTCELFFADKLKTSTVYTLTISNDVLSLDGYYVTENDGTVLLETPKGIGSYTFTDNATTLDKIYETSGEVILSSNFYDVPVYGLKSGVKEGYVVYKMEGDITGFTVSSAGHGRDKYETNSLGVAGTNLPKVFVSVDGVNYTQLEDEVHFRDSARWETETWKRHDTITSIEGSLPEGIRYFKILFPILKDGQTDDNAQRAISNVSFTYAIRNPKIYMSNCNMAVEDDGSVSYSVDLGISNELITPLTPSDIEVVGTDIECIDVTQDPSTLLYTLTFDKPFEFGKEYTLTLSDTLKDIYGSYFLESMRSETITVPEKPSLVPEITNEYTVGGTAATALVTGEYKNVVTLTGLYFNGSNSRSVTLVSVVYSGDKIVDIKTYTDDVYVNYGTNFIFEHTISDSDTRVETFILGDLSSGNPLAKQLKLSR